MSCTTLLRPCLAAETSAGARESVLRYDGRHPAQPTDRERRSVCSSRNVFPMPAPAVFHRPTALCKSANAGTSFRSSLFVYSVYVRDYSTAKKVCQGFIFKKSDKNYRKKHRVDWRLCRRASPTGTVHRFLNNPPWRYTSHRFPRCIRGGGRRCRRASAQTCRRWRQHRWA